MRIFWFLFFLQFLLIKMIIGQQIELNDQNNVTRSIGNNLSPKWSPDAEKILFQSNRNGNWDLFIYSINKDSLEQITNTEYNEQNPVWINNGKSIAFDSDKTGEEKLYQLNLITKELKLLFDRPIRSIQPSFSKSEKLVYFSGFDPNQKRWEIYSFEFFYQNLNKLTNLDSKSAQPVVSPDEDHVVFTNHSKNFPFEKLHIMNWYGNEKEFLTDFNAFDAHWDNSGLKLYFISKEKNILGDVYSMWIDGSHQERLTSFTSQVRYPTVSPDGRFMAFCIKNKKGFDIFIVSLEEY